MGTGHRVVRKRKPLRPILPKEVVPVAPRRYRDRFGREYDVIWAGDRQDFPLIPPRETVR
jgi:hypothetical protein